MLLESGDLIPVKRAAVDIPWTRRKSQVQNYLHRGPVEFATYVYDTNVGDIAPLSTYFNPHRWTVSDLNHKFGTKQAFNIPREISMRTSPANVGEGDDVKSKSLQPKLMINLTEEEELMQQFQTQGMDTSRLQIVRSSGQPLPEVEKSVSSGCECCSKDEWRIGSIFKPKAIRATSVPNQKQPESPVSPLRKIWLPVQSVDSDSVFRFRRNSVSPNECLEPIGPPKRRRLTSMASSPVFDSDWPTFGGFKSSMENLTAGNDLKRKMDNPMSDSLKMSYFSILNEDSAWSPWKPLSTPKFELSAGEQKEQVDGLVSSLRKIAQQSEVFFA